MTQSVKHHDFTHVSGDILNAITECTGYGKVPLLSERAETEDGTDLTVFLGYDFDTFPNLSLV